MDCTNGVTDLCNIYSCTEDISIPDSQKCQITPVNCSDSNSCTIDTCDPNFGCIYTPLSCDDQDCCTLDSCQDGVCVHIPSCEDNNPCTVDNCKTSCPGGMKIFILV